MTTELLVLFLTGVMTFIMIGIQGIQVPLNFGFKWGLGNRDQARPPTIFMNRIARAMDNQIQALAIAIPVILTLVLYPSAQSDLTQWGAWTFLAGRFAFVVCYLLGIPYLRSLVWMIGLIGWMMMTYGILVVI